MKTYRLIGGIAAIMTAAYSSYLQAQTVTVQGVSSAPASHDTKLTAYVTVSNDSDLKVKASVAATASLPGTQVTKTKSVTLNPHETKTVAISGIRLKPYTYSDVSGVSASVTVTSSSQSSGSTSSGSRSSGGSNLSGEWGGSYSHPYEGSSGVSASITQNGSSITISASNGISLSGKASKSKIRARDGNGQTWTSQGRVTQNYIFIRDYLLEYPQRHPPLEQSLTLSR
jgi:hypothetical protein